MKIGILTQPMHNNYGGLLQNFALQRVLKKLGHEPITINIIRKETCIFIKLLSILKRILLNIFRQNVIIRIFPTKKEKKIISKYTKQFIQQNIKTTKAINQKVNQDLLRKYDFDAYIVGSDQVWRPRYSPQQSTFFLDFLVGNKSVKKIAYAASFGVNEWEFNEKQTAEFNKLIKQFDAVSVREDSAVDLCKKYFNVEATQLLDPVMLLDREEYISVVNKGKVKKSPGNLLTYILDKDTEKNKIIKMISQKYNLNPFSVMPYRSFSESGKRDINACIFPRVEEWIRGFMDAEFVITDSFHGTVFSILFNKPFIAIANKSRGITRFTSLLKLFQFENRLIFSPAEFELQNIREIDWEHANSILKQERVNSIQFLIEQLYPIK